MLAVVIPFYKVSFFEALLKALAAQTCQDFNIYIGNDCSQSDPSPILKCYQDQLNITYKRFDERLGHISLTSQWDRCVEMVHDEEWVWVLPDDDVPSSNVVEEFYKAMQLQNEYNIKVFRFPLSIIDQKGRVISEIDNKDPVVETNLDFYQRVVRGKATASLGEYFHFLRGLVRLLSILSFCASSEIASQSLINLTGWASSQASTSAIKSSPFTFVCTHSN